MTIRRVAIGVAANLFDKTAITAAQIIQVPVLATAWGLHIYGIWLLLSTVPSFLAMGDLGLGTAAGVKMTMAEARGDRASAICTFQSAFVAILSSSVVLVLGSLMLSQIVPITWFGITNGFGPGEIRKALLILLLYGVATVQQSIIWAGLRCAGLFAVTALAHGCIILLETVLVVTLALSGAHPVSVALGLLTGRCCGIVVAAIVLHRCAPWMPLGIRAASRNEIVSLVAPAGSVMLQPLANALYLQGSAIALGVAAGTNAVPAFTAVRTLSRIGLQACLLLNTALMPEFSVAIARHDRDAVSSIVLVTMISSAIVAIPAVVALAVFGEPILALWSKHTIVPSSGLLYTISASTALICLWYPLSNLLLARQRQFAISLSFAILSLIGIPITYVTARYSGAQGAGLVMAVIDLLMLIVILMNGRRWLASADELLAAAPLIWGRLPKLMKRVRRA